MVGRAVVGQQDLHLHLRRKVPAAQEEGVQGAHGRRIRMHNRLLAGNEVRIVTVGRTYGLSL